MFLMCSFLHYDYMVIEFAQGKLTLYILKITQSPKLNLSRMMFTAKPMLRKLIVKGTLAEIRIAYKTNPAGGS